MWIQTFLFFSSHKDKKWSDTAGFDWVHPKSNQRNHLTLPAQGFFLVIDCG